jgi:endonuclease YncB( thermonuclease family)
MPRKKISPQYIYACTIDRAVDADTYDVTIDVGFTWKCRPRVRLVDVDSRDQPVGIDCPEIGTEEGRQARKEAVAKIVATGASKAMIQTFKPDALDASTLRDSFGRYLAAIFLDGESLAGWLVETGWAKKWAKKRTKKGETT